MLEEDFSVYTDPTGLGDSSLVGGATVNGIFDRQWAEVNQVEGYYPTFLVSDVDAAKIIKRQTEITLNGTVYQAISKRPDGTGMTLLVLEKQ